MAAANVYSQLVGDGTPTTPYKPAVVSEYNLLTWNAADARSQDQAWHRVLITDTAAVVNAINADGDYSATDVITVDLPDSAPSAVTATKDWPTINENDVVVLEAGIYVADTFTIPAGAHLSANGRVILAKSDGTAPNVTLRQYASIDGFWVVGARSGTTGLIDCGKDNSVTNCVFSGIQMESEFQRCTIRDCLFVRCGLGTLEHGIYYSDSGTTAGNGPTFQGNVFVGCSGYAIHNFHEAAYPTVLENGIFDCYGGIAIDGVGSTVRHNVVWSTRAIAMFASATAAGSIDGNLIGRDVGTYSLASPVGLTISGNTFVYPAVGFGSSTIFVNPWQVEELGISFADVDAAMNALETSFLGTVAQINADATIVGNFATLKNVVNVWKVQ